LIRRLKPDAVLIEGPRDATALVPMILHHGTRLPIALFATFVERPQDDVPQRHAAYYPLCDYSPEYVAIRAAADIGARCRFIDLTFPEIHGAERHEPEGRVASLFDEHYLRHSRRLQAACRRAGVRDPDDLWDHLYEVDYQQWDTADFMRNVLAYCWLARADYTPEMLAAEGCLAREQAMAAAVAEEPRRMVIVTGGFHTVALPTTAPRLPPPLDLAPGDASLVLMRYGFEQLDRLNGYASGMPSPEFYQRCWEGRDPAELLVELGRQLREQNLGTSTADAIAACDHARRCAQLRGHRHVSREDLLDAVRSTFIKGCEDVEGVLVLAHARKLLAGCRIGDLPPEAGQPPIIQDFRAMAARLGLEVDVVDAREVTLDLYRNRRHREISRFLLRLRFLGVGFAEVLRGPDFVLGEGLERIQEVWRYRWEPAQEGVLIERSMYGATVESAAAALLLERFRKSEAEGRSRHADLAARLLLEACRMGLHRHAQDLLDRTTRLAAEDGAFTSVVGAMESVLALVVSREPLEAQHLRGLPELAETLYQRACYLLPELARTPEEELAAALDALNAWRQAVQTLGDDPDRQTLRWSHLEKLASTEANPAIRGAATGLLYGDGRIEPPELARQVACQFQSTQDEGAGGPAFLRGLLRTARSVLWQVPDLLAAVHGVLGEWDEARFIRQLPLLRLAFADLTPRECDQVARAVGAHAGVERFQVHSSAGFSEQDLLCGVELERHVAEALTQDGLEEYLGR
jgi:hypothetical protein